ncbi:hypothetical protein F53441_13519 [Fusarium austroafricanum]|uniref:Uncharacterized protein n=1 Tax=Fusarium austroafricanum TaxID=2364996 RepID=A0A8H4JNW6_9HYPO|nr:hypothetical protein F53441_13519 [Fusarium austroafricanum]
MPIPYHEPEVVREAALQFIAQVEAGESFPLLASGGLILCPETHYETWNEQLEERAQAAAINFCGSDKWDRSTHLLMELTRTLTADPLLWCHADEMSTSTLALDPRMLQLRSASIFGGRAGDARVATPEEVRRVVEELPIICLGELKEWSVENDHSGFPIVPYAWARALRFYDYHKAARFDEIISRGQVERQGSMAIS